MNIRPDAEVRDEEDNSIGPKFLRDYVKSLQTGSDGLKEKEREEEAPTESVP